MASQSATEVDMGFSQMNVLAGAEEGVDDVLRVDGRAGVTT
jgi:hypothetical protein